MILLGGKPDEHLPAVGASSQDQGEQKTYHNHSDAQVYLGQNQQDTATGHDGPAGLSGLFVIHGTPSFGLSYGPQPRVSSFHKHEEHPTA